MDLTSLEQLKEAILTEDIIENLYNYKLSVTKEIGISHEKVATAYNNLEKLKEKGILTSLYALQEVCNFRIEDVRDSLKDKKSEKNKFNYNFRKVCKLELDSETYANITKLAQTRMKDNFVEEVPPSRQWIENDGSIENQSLNLLQCSNCRVMVIEGVPGDPCPKCSHVLN